MLKGRWALPLLCGLGLTRPQPDTNSLAACPASGSIQESGDALGLRDDRAAAKHVAIAFHGQFLHGRTPTKRADAVLPPTWGDKSVAFDSFVATSTQQLEHKPCLVLDGQKLCDALRAKGGFRFAQCELRPYNASFFIRWAFSMGLPWRDAARYSLYPHRVLSDFSTIGRALERISAHERRAGELYDLIAVTRIDVFFYFLKALPPFGLPGSWYDSVVQARVVGRRSAHKPLWEDRFIIGRRDDMLTMGQLTRHFVRNFIRLGNLSYPEAQVYAHFAEDVLKIPRRERKTRRPFEAYLQIEGFRQNKGKFRRWFIVPPPDLPVDEKWRRPAQAVAAGHRATS